MVALTIQAYPDEYPMGDEPQDNLRRMFADMRRVDRARRFLDGLLQTGADLTIIALDLDRSAVVRRRGVGEKRRLVVQLHELVRSGIPADATFLDSGSRDEGWIVLSSATGAAARRIAYDLRTRVAEWDFRMSDGEQVRLTVSLGIVRASLHGTTGMDLLWAAGEALWQAKLTRNAVCVAQSPIEVVPHTFSIPDDQRRQLAHLADRTRRSIESLVHESLQLLLENHAPRWHWIVDRGGPVAGEPDHRFGDGTRR